MVTSGVVTSVCPTGISLSILRLCGVLLVGGTAGKNVCLLTRIRRGGPGWTESVSVLGMGSEGKAHGELKRCLQDNWPLLEQSAATTGAD